MSNTPGKELSLADRAAGSSSNPGLTNDREKSCDCRITALTRNAHSLLIKSLKHSVLSTALPLIWKYITGFYHSFFLYLSGAGLKRYNLIILEEAAKSMSGIVKWNNKGSRRNQVVWIGNQREFLAEVASPVKAGTCSLPWMEEVTAPDCQAAAN